MANDELDKIVAKMNKMASDVRAAEKESQERIDQTYAELTSLKEKEQFEIREWITYIAEVSCNTYAVSKYTKVSLEWITYRLEFLQTIVTKGFSNLNNNPFMGMPVAPAPPSPQLSMEINSLKHQLREIEELLKKIWSRIP